VNLKEVIEVGAILLVIGIAVVTSLLTIGNRKDCIYEGSSLQNRD